MSTPTDRPSICVSLPDGRELALPEGATAADLAAKIGPGLARAALAATVDGEVRDLARPLPDGAEVRLLTERDPEALGVLRHSAAHVLATAVRELVPTAGIGFGPAIDDGFYYDFDVPEPFTPEQVAAIEERMAAVIEADHPFERQVVSRQEACDLFSDDPLKLERLGEIG
ncbi:MAG: TGS domain-containing protein, partial [Gemmatimonadetes bacterium]|nr:TGS domain-containing protein [Gemmatimonadota bacterium]